MSDGGPSKQAGDSQGTPKKPPEGPDPEPVEDTESAEAARTLHNTLVQDYSMYVKAWRAPVEIKRINIDKEKKYGQIRKINWDDVAQKAQFNITSQPSGPFQCTLWEDAKGDLWCISGQHTILAIGQCVKERQAAGLLLQEWHNIVHADILRYNTPLMIRRKIAGHSRERTEAVTPLTMADTAANLLMTNADEPPVKDIDAFDVRILDVLEMCAKVHRAHFNDDNYKVFSLLSLVSLQCSPSIVLFASNSVQYTSDPFQTAETKKWRAFMAFVYWGGEDAVNGIRQLEDKLRYSKHKLTLWALKSLESVWLPKFHQEVAHHLLRHDATVKTLTTFVEDIRKRQWIYLHVNHPDNKLIAKTVGMLSFCLACLTLHRAY